LSDAFSEERLMQLDERWRRDPSSRIFVQLAEEYRRGGRLVEAMGVLEQGLLAHPSYLSALVALGRCRLENGDPARAADVLEQAVALDATQMVANKLLVEAYLRTGRTDKARERLNLYRLINDRDGEIEALERRIEKTVVPSPPRPAVKTAAISQTPPAAPPAPAAPPEAELLPEPETTRKLTPTRSPEPPPESPRAGDIFDLRHPDAGPLELAPPLLRATLARPAEPFGALREPLDAQRRIARALSAGGLFPMAIPTAPPPLPAAPAPPVEAVERAALPGTGAVPEAAAVEPLQVEAPAAGTTAPPWGAAPRSAELELEARDEVVAAPFSTRSIGEEVERETIEEPFDEVYQATSATVSVPPPRAGMAPPVPFAVPEPLVEVAPEPLEVAPEPLEAEETPAAIPEVEEPEPAIPAQAAVEPAPAAEPSATLGELFLSQGHLEEAEHEFLGVIAVRPDDDAAHAGLAEIARRRFAPESAEPAAFAPARSPAPGLTRRKIETLRGYLERLRRASGGQRVS
jgi:tetratricopeptide (TPR) repeat protein